MPVSSVTEHWIRQDALTINLNHFGDPDYLQVSLLAGAVVMAFKQDVIGYNAAHNYRTWPLEAANTYLETSSAYHVYAKLTRSEVNARALVVYDTKLRDIEGREITYDSEGGEVLGDSNADYFFVYLGKISSSIDRQGNRIQRIWEIGMLYGTLTTTEQNNYSGFLFDKMFRPHYDDPLNPDRITSIEALSGLWTQYFLSAKGLSTPTSSGDGGLIKQVYGYSDINKVFSNSNLNDTFNAYTIARLSARITALEQNGGGGVADSIEWEKVLYKPSWLVDKKPSVSFFDNDAKYITIDSLADYATQKWVEDKKYITSSALSGYATEEWVTDKGYAVATDVASTYATIEALNKKLDKDKFAESFATEMAKWFIKDDTNKGIKPVNSYGLYSDTYVSAKGISSGTGGGGGGTSYDRLDAWADYTSAKAGYVLSALLGYDLHTRVNNLANAGYITANALNGYAKLTDIPTIPTSLKNPYALSFGNKLYDGSAANTITASDLGALTSHQDISHLLSKTEAASTYQTIISSNNKISYSNISGTPTSLPASDVYSWAKAASKPSYAFSEIANKPTTLGGYGITDWDVNAYNGNDLNTFYDAGLKLIRNASFNYPSKGNYGSMLVMPYRKAFGNTITDFAAQIFLPNGDDSANPNDMFFRTSLENTWNEWQRVLTNNNYTSYTYSQTTIDSKLSGYLPLSGGTMNGTISYTSNAPFLSLYRLDGETPYLRFGLQSDKLYGEIGVDSNGEPVFWGYVSGNTTYNKWVSIIHSGNIGSQSVNYASSAGNADTLDGYHSTDFTKSQIDNSDNFLSYTNRARFQTSFISDQWDFCSLVIPTWTGNNANNWYLTELRFELGGNLKVRASKDGNVEYGWKTIAFTDSNVASATKLQTARTIWGQSFDGSGDVDGKIYQNGKWILGCHADGNLYIGLDTYSTNDTLIYGRNLYFGTLTGTSMIINSSSNVLIGTNTDNGAKLQVNGGISFGYYRETSISAIGNYLSLSTRSNEICISGTINETLYINYRKNHSGYAPKTWLWKAGSSDSWAEFDLGKITFESTINIKCGKNALEVDTVSGKSWFGMMNTTACHIYTDAPMFYMDKLLSVPELNSRGNIVATGSVTAKSSSDYRLKCEFDYDVDYQERLLSLGKVCDYRYTEHARQRNTGGVDGNRHTGLIWQDAKRVGLTNFALIDEDGYGSLNYLSTDYLNTITGAVQMTIIGVRSLLDRTEKIEDKVERLEKENEALRKEINDMKGGRYGC